MEGHIIACFSDDGEAAGDESVDEEPGSRIELKDWSVKVKVNRFTSKRQDGFSYMDSAVAITEARGNMLGIVARKLSIT